jgi:hypothetical protein
MTLSVSNPAVPPSKKIGTAMGPDVKSTVSESLMSGAPVIARLLTSAGDLVLVTPFTVTVRSLPLAATVIAWAWGSPERSTYQLGAGGGPRPLPGTAAGSVEAGSTFVRVVAPSDGGGTIASELVVAGVFGSPWEVPAAPVADIVEATVGEESEPSTIDVEPALVTGVADVVVGVSGAVAVTISGVAVPADGTRAVEVVWVGVVVVVVLVVSLEVLTGSAEAGARVTSSVVL